MAVERPLETPMSPMMEGEALEIEIVDPESVSISSGDETFFEFDEEGFIEDALYQLKCVLKYDKVFRNGEEE